MNPFVLPIISLTISAFVFIFVIVAIYRTRTMFREIKMYLGMSNPQESSMIVGITELLHDYPPRVYFLNTSLLDSTNPVDAAIQKAVADQSTAAWIDAQALKLEEPHVTVAAKQADGPAYRLIVLSIQCE